MATEDRPRKLRLREAIGSLDIRKTVARDAAAQFQVDHAEELAQLRAEEEHLESLPEHERREILDSMGLHHVSAQARPLSGAEKVSDLEYVQRAVMRRQTARPKPPPPERVVRGNTVRSTPFGLREPGGDESSDPTLESPSDRRSRRLATIRERGGDIRRAGTGWHMVGEKGVLAKLAREEQAAGMPMSDSKDLKRDLIAAATGEQRGS